MLKWGFELFYWFGFNFVLRFGYDKVWMSCEIYMCSLRLGL